MLIFVSFQQSSQRLKPSNYHEAQLCFCQETLQRFTAGQQSALLSSFPPREFSNVPGGTVCCVCVCVSVYTVHHPLPQLDLTDALKMLCHASPGNVHHPRFIYMPGLDSSVCSPSRVSATPHSAVRFSPSFHPTIPFSGYLWEQRLEAAFPGNTNLPGFSLRDGAK